MKSSFYSAQASADLRAIFAELRDLTEGAVDSADGPSRPKYSDKVLYSVGQMVLFRCHGKQMRSLCILLVAAINASNGRGYAEFIWLGGAGNRHNCAEYIGRLLPGEPMPQTTSVIATKDGISFCFAEPEGKTLNVQYEFIPLLACLLEFMLRSLGPTAIDAVCQALSSETHSVQELDEIANALTRDIYAWLVPHVESKHHQDEFNNIGHFFVDQFGPDFTAEDIDDESIFMLWEHKSANDDENRKSKSTKKFGSTYVECLRFMDLLSGSIDLDHLESAVSITSAVGDARGSGEVTMDSVAHLQSIPHAVDDEVAISDLRLKIEISAHVFGSIAAGDSEDVLTPLTQSTVNIVNSGDYRVLNEIFRWERWIVGLPLSYLRYRAFGSISKVGGNAWKAIFEANDYEKTVSSLMTLERYTDDAVAACLYLRAQRGSLAAPSNVASLVEKRGKDFLKKQRAGFQDALAGQAEACAAFLDAEEGLLASKLGLSKVTSSLQNSSIETEKYEIDRDRFTQHFEVISGSKSHE